MVHGEEVPSVEPWTLQPQPHGLGLDPSISAALSRSPFELKHLQGPGPLGTAQCQAGSSPDMRLRPGWALFPLPTLPGPTALFLSLSFCLSLPHHQALMCSSRPIVLAESTLSPALGHRPLGPGERLALAFNSRGLWGYPQVVSHII